MLWVASFICFLSAVYHFDLNRGRLVSVGGVISLLWGIVNMINAMSPFDWFPLNDQCEFVVFFGSMALVLGLLTTKQVPRLETDLLVNGINKNVAYRYFFIIQILLLIIMMPMVVKAIGVLSSNNYNMVVLRKVYASGGEDGFYMSTWQRLFYIHYVIGPCSLACVQINAMLFFKHGMWKKPFIFIVLLSLMMSIYSAARTPIFFAAIAVFVAYLQYKRKINNPYNSKIVRRRIVLFFLLLVAFMTVITILRGNADNGAVGYVFKTLASYFCGGTRVLNQALESPELFGLDSYTYGYCCFAGLFSIINLINMMFGFVGVNLLPMDFASDMHVQTYLIYNIRIGTESSINAFPTMFYFFLRDGGIIYLMLFVFIMGNLLTRYENKSVKSNSLKHAFIYNLCFYTAIMSVCWWEPMRTEFWTILVWGLILCNLIDKNILVMKK